MSEDHGFLLYERYPFVVKTGVGGEDARSSLESVRKLVEKTRAQTRK